MKNPTIAFAAPTIKKVIRDAYETKRRAIDSLEQLRIGGDELTATRVDAWTADVAARGVDFTSVAATHDTVKRELETHQKKVEAVESLLGLVELRIKQLKTQHGSEVIEVLKERIATLQKEKSNDERDVEAANETIANLWKEVRELDPDAPSTGSRKK